MSRFKPALFVLCRRFVRQCFRDILHRNALPCIDYIIFTSKSFRNFNIADKSVVNNYPLTSVLADAFGLVNINMVNKLLQKRRCKCFHFHESAYSFYEAFLVIFSFVYFAELSSDTVPVLIENNPGLMGYKIIIRYDKGLVPVKVTQGEAIKGGNFNDSIETSDNNEFVVVWSNTADKKTNGKLFEIKFNVDSNIANDCEIKVLYLNLSVLKADCPVTSIHR